MVASLLGGVWDEGFASSFPMVEPGLALVRRILSGVELNISANCNNLYN